MVSFRTALYPVSLAAFMAAAWIKLLSGTGTEDDSFDRYLKMAKLNEEKDVYIIAAECYEKAAEIRDDNGELILLAAENYLKCGEESMFLSCCRQAVSNENTGDRPWLLMGEYYLENGYASEAASLLKRIPEKRRSPEADELFARVSSCFHKGYRSYEAAKPFYGGYCAVNDAGLWGLADRSDSFCILPGYEEMGAYNSDDDVVSVCSDGVWFLVNARNQVRFLPSEKYTWLGSYNSGLVPFCCDGVYGYTDLEYNEKTEKYDFAGSFNEGVAAVMKNGKWAVVSPSLEEITGYDFDEIILDSYGFCAHNGQIRALVNGEEIFLDLNGNRCEYRTVYSCGLAPVKFGEFYGYENETGDIAVEAYFDEVTDFSEDGSALVLEDGMWRIITLDVYS